MKITSLAFPINNYKNPEFKLTSTIDGRRSILSWNCFEERPFPSSNNSHFQNEACENEFHLHETKNSFPYQEGEQREGAGDGTVGLGFSSRVH